MGAREAGAAEGAQAGWPPSAADSALPLPDSVLGAAGSLAEGAELAPAPAEALQARGCAVSAPRQGAAGGPAAVVQRW